MQGRGLALGLSWRQCTRMELVMELAPDCFQLLFGYFGLFVIAFRRRHSVLHHHQVCVCFCAPLSLEE